MKIEKLEYYSSSNDGYTWQQHPTVGDIVDKINEIVNVLNEVKSGEWFFEEYPDGYYHSECSECGAWYGEEAFLEKWNYCPDCGVRMNGENKND